MRSSELGSRLEESCGCGLALGSRSGAGVQPRAVCWIRSVGASRACASDNDYYDTLMGGGREV